MLLLVNIYPPAKCRMCGVSMPRFNATTFSCFAVHYIHESTRKPVYVVVPAANVLKVAWFTRSVFIRVWAGNHAKDTTMP